MIHLPDGSTASPWHILTALAEEAHRRGVSYGELTASLDGYSREKLIREYWKSRLADAAKQSSPGECAGCPYWRSASMSTQTTAVVCHFMYDTGNPRRKGQNGECLEREEAAKKRCLWRPNDDIRREAKAAGIMLRSVAEHMHIAEQTLFAWLRKPMTDEKRQLICSTIEELREMNRNDSIDH